MQNAKCKMKCERGTNRRDRRPRLSITPPLWGGWRQSRRVRLRYTNFFKNLIRHSQGSCHLPQRGRVNSCLFRTLIFHFAFCILHFAFCILHFSLVLFAFISRSSASTSLPIKIKIRPPRYYPARICVLKKLLSDSFKKAAENLLLGLLTRF